MGDNRASTVRNGNDSCLQLSSAQWQPSVCSISRAWFPMEPLHWENKRACMSGLCFLAPSSRSGSRSGLLAGGWAGLQHQRCRLAVVGKPNAQDMLSCIIVLKISTPRNGAFTLQSAWRRLQEAFPAPWCKIETECAKKQNRKIPTFTVASRSKDWFLINDLQHLHFFKVPLTTT